MHKLFLPIILFLTCNLFAQDSTVTEAFKDNRPWTKYPLIKPANRSYPLMAGYLLNKYSNDGDPIAQHELGLRYLLGKGFPKDTIKAIYWIRRAVDKQLASAKYNYSIILDNGIGVDWNPFEAFKHSKYAAESGMPEAQFFFGIFFTSNLVVNRDYNEAYKWFKKSAEGKYQPAIDAIKNMEESGLLVDIESANGNGSKEFVIDSLKASSSAIFSPDYELDFFEFESTDDDSTVKLIQKLYSKEFKELQTSLGIARNSDDVQLKDTTGQGVVAYAAERGSPEGLLIIAKDYEQGVSRNKNKIKAAEAFIKAYRLGAIKAFQSILTYSRSQEFYNLLKKESDANNPAAMFVWAGLTALGFDYQLTNVQALELLERAANLNHVNSLVEKGLCYYTGTLVEKDRNKAFEYWERAIEQGSIEAEVRLAFSRLIDESVISDGSYNIGVLNKYAAQGSVLAQAALAFCFENGIVVKRNKAKAAKLYRSASHRGSEVAYNSLKRIYDAIRPDDEQFIIYESQ
jgi:TPR repeat protein